MPLLSIPSAGTAAVILVLELTSKVASKLSPLGIWKKTPVTASKPCPVISTLDPVTPLEGPKLVALTWVPWIAYSVEKKLTWFGKYFWVSVPADSGLLTPEVSSQGFTIKNLPVPTNPLSNWKDNVL